MCIDQVYSKVQVGDKLVFELQTHSKHPLYKATVTKVTKTQITLKLEQTLVRVDWKGSHQEELVTSHYNTVRISKNSGQAIGIDKARLAFYYSLEGPKKLYTWELLDKRERENQLEDERRALVNKVQGINFKRLDAKTLQAILDLAENKES